MKWKHVVIIPGRASHLQLQWTEESSVDIILVYSPNDLTVKLDFYRRLVTYVNSTQLVDPILMGDFNFVEGSLDRTPQHSDDNRLNTLINIIKKKYDLTDGWRTCNPTDLGFTYTHSNNSMSRIDRIYVTEDTFEYTYNWEITNNIAISDHQMASMTILRKQLPYIGKGTWRMHADQI
ncbi:uncharacterized protein B0H18DRAFT_895662, partial [Fomitopsis serialis]|uniref:uncharacterized protein n=1 Tax=Fomitopsis serialis TaxID=139415 RepID=UPI002007BCA9